MKPDDATVSDASDPNVDLGTPLKKSGKQVSLEVNHGRRKRSRGDNIVDDTDEERVLPGTGNLFLSQDTFDEENILGQLLPIIEKGPRSASELLAELRKSPGSFQNGRRPSAQTLSASLETIESVLELAVDVDQYIVTVPPCTGVPQLPSWADVCMYTTSKRDKIQSERLGPLKEKSPYGMLIAKHEEEFRELMQ